MTSITHKLRGAGLGVGLVAVLSLAIAFGIGRSALADHDPFGGAEQTGVRLCHFVEASDYTSVEATVTASSTGTSTSVVMLDGHETDQDDIIPPFHYAVGEGRTDSYPGQNWDDNTEALWENDCEPSGTATSTQGVLTIIKNVINNNGGTSTASDFSLSVENASGTVVAGPAAGSASGTSYTLDAGVYSVIEATSTGYTAAFGDCGDDGEVTVAGGATTTCTVVNNDIVPAATTTARLTVTKVVVNNSGSGTSTVGDFDLSVTPTGTTTGATTSVASGVETEFEAGTYDVGESGPAGYAASFSGDCDADGDIALASGGTYSCTITNNDIPEGMGVLTVRKVIVNDNGGTATTSDFTLMVAGPSGTSTATTSVGSGVEFAFAPGTYAVSESGTSTADYGATFGGDCAADGSIAIAAGEAYSCVITNNDIASSSGPVPECRDGVDNDSDGEIDFPEDSRCASLDDDSEDSRGGGGGGSSSRRRSSSDNDDDEDEDEDDDGEVLGATSITDIFGSQFAQVPVGAPNTGRGGTAERSFPLAVAFLSLAAAGSALASRELRRMER